MDDTDDTTANEPAEEQPDPLDEAAAMIDPRSPEAPEDVEALIETSEELGRDPDQPKPDDPDDA